MSNFYAQYKSIKPWLRALEPGHEQLLRAVQEHQALARGLGGRQGRREGALPEQGGPRQARRALRVHPLRVLLHELPELLAAVDDAFKLYRCKTIMNCASVCPKGLNPGKGITKIKKALHGDLE